MIKCLVQTGNGKLDKKELGAMLQDLAGGKPPTDEECGFVLHMADASDHAIDGFIGHNELEAAVHIYNEYLAHKSEIDERMKKYDVNRSGKLELNQLQSLLTDLNDGNPPSIEEVHARTHARTRARAHTHTHTQRERDSFNFTHSCPEVLILHTQIHVRARTHTHTDTHTAPIRLLSPTIAISA